MTNFRPFDRETAFLLPPSIDEWLPRKHLARFIVELIAKFDLSSMIKSYRGSGGSEPYHPQVLLALIVYGYATGVFSSRRLERATHDSVAFRFITANSHPDHTTIATFRSRFLPEIEDIFLQVLKIAKEMGLLQFGNVGLDGTKIHANASKHSALSYEHACKIEDHLTLEVKELMAMAEAADKADVADGLSIPDELERREERLRAIAEAKAKIEARAAERYARDKAEYDAKMAARDAKQKETGKKPGGKEPKAPEEGPRPKDQINITDEDSRIMPVSGGGFEQCYNAQALVCEDSLFVVAADVVQDANDKRQIEPMLKQIADLPEELGAVETLLGDNGFFSEANVNACVAAGIEPLLAMSKESHHKGLRERFAKDPETAPENPTPLEAMIYRFQTRDGKKLYAKRKHTPEPVFGIIKSVLGFRHFLLRGLEKVKGEWRLVTMAWNIKRLFALMAA
jgi:transposase